MANRLPGMGQGKSINLKAKRLLDLHGYNKKQFAQLSETTYSAIHDFFTNDRNVTLKLFQKIMKPLGVDIDDILDEKIDSLLGKTNKTSQEVNDIALLIESLDKIQRKTLLTTALQFYKLNKGKNDELVERISRKQT